MHFGTSPTCRAWIILFVGQEVSIFSDTRACWRSMANRCTFRGVGEEDRPLIEDVNYRAESKGRCCSPLVVLAASLTTLLFITPMVHTTLAMRATKRTSISLDSADIQKGQENELPTIMLFLLDDLGYNDIGYQSIDIPLATPFMTQLATESGVILDSYYSLLECTPARAALMTGRYPIRTGMQHECLQANSPWGLNLQEVLLPQYLKRLGNYSTHMIGDSAAHFDFICFTTTRQVNGTWGILLLHFGLNHVDSTALLG